MVALDLPSLARRLPSRPVTRFAPSPTGYLHLGHVANAAYVWGIAGALDGRVLLRLEDHDRIRCRPEYESALLEDLDWLGFAPDRGTTTEFRAGPSNFRQSDCEEIYRAALARLSDKAPVYACDCSRRDIAEDGGDAFNQETRYSGRCRDRGLPLADETGVRLGIAPGPERFVDGLLGDQVQDPSEQGGDLLLRDLLPSTGRQIQLARLLGRANPPLFVHHPLIRKSGGVKLSKATGDTGIRELRRQEVPPSAVLGQAAYLTGLLPTPRELRPADLAGLVAAG